MKSSLLALTATLLTLLSPPASAADHELLNALSRVMNRCPERVWPEYSWKNFHVLEVQADGRGFLLAGKTGAIVELEDKQLPETVKNSPFAFFKVGDGTGMSINAAIYEAQLKNVNGSGYTDDQRFYSSVDLAFHEAFHHVAQAGWPERSGALGTELPILAQPRIYRRALFNEMLAAFRNPSARGPHLARAKFWFEKWKQEFPREVASTTDLSEGTAQYAGLVASALARLGCQTSDADLRRELSKVVNNAPDSFSKGKFTNGELPKEFALDNEGYDTGGLASFLLRFDEKAPQWEASAKQGVSPVDLLLANVQAEPASFDPALQKEYEAIEQREKLRTDELLAPALSNLADPSAVIVALPSAWGSGGTYSPFGFFYDVNRSLQYIPLRLELAFSSEEALKNGSAVTAGEHSVMVDGFANSPCPGRVSYWHTLVPKAAIEREGSTFILSDLYVKGRLRGELKRGEDGREWLCGY